MAHGYIKRNGIIQDYEENDDIEFLISIWNKTVSDISSTISLREIRPFTFYSCSLISSAVFPSCTKIWDSAFQDCIGLESISFPECTTISAYAFHGCTSLVSISFPNCTTIGYHAFEYCSSIKLASFPKCTTIEDSAFYYCASLFSLYFLVSSVPTLSSTMAFYGTPIADSSYVGQYGSIYVPSSLYSKFRARTNWSFYASRLSSYAI